jgi:hypothetical protein
MRLLPDRSQLAFVAAIGEGEGVAPAEGVMIADLATGTCCDVVVGPDTMVADAVAIGPFSPDASQLLVSYAQVYTQDRDDGLLAIIDLDSLSIVQELDLQAAFGDQGAYFGDWTEDGIALLPTCLACEGPTSGYYARWNPATGEIAPAVDFVDFRGDELSGTGEYLVRGRDESRPLRDDDTIPPSNVLEYLPAGDPEESTIVYFDPENLYLQRPVWVIDGQAYLLPVYSAPAQLVFRDGTQQSVDLPVDLRLVAGTPDGWLMQGPDWTLYQFRYVDGEVIATVVAQLPGEVIILSAPLLGAADLESMTPIIG